MSDESPSRRIGCITTIVVLMATLVALAMRDAFFGILYYLTTGWASFAVRTIRSVTFDVSTAMTGVVCLCIFVFGLDRIARWLNGNWNWRRTCIVSALVLITFVAGTSAVGVVHQTSWIARAPERSIVGGSWDTANRVRTQNNIRQIGIAAVFLAEKDSVFPAGCTFGSKGEMMHGWLTCLLPHVEGGTIYGDIDINKPWNSPINATPIKKVFRPYLSPLLDIEADAAGFGITHYAGNCQVLRPRRSLKLGEITDGTSNTILAGEVAMGFRPWAHPLNMRDPAKGLGPEADKFFGPGGGRDSTIVVLADGSARAIKNNISPAVLKALATPNGGETIDEDW